MSRDLADRIRELYSGEAGEVWARIERESPANYWEENAILGRRDLVDQLLERLGSLAGRRILDAGCGRGLLTRRLSRAGAHVTGVDLLHGHVVDARARAGAGAARFAVADFRDVLRAAGAFDEVILMEVLEDYGPDERQDTIRALASCGASHIHLIFRQPGRWGGLIGPLMPATLTSTLDPVSLMRSVHRHTPYRLSSQETLHRRSYNVMRVEFTLQPDLMSSNVY